MAVIGGAFASARCITKVRSARHGTSVFQRHTCEAAALLFVRERADGDEDADEDAWSGEDGVLEDEEEEDGGGGVGAFTLEEEEEQQ